MNKTAFRAAAVTATLLLAALGAYWYWSPYLAMYNLQQAAKKNDADAFNEGVDYPALRESIKEQTLAALGTLKGKELDNPFIVMGAALLETMVNQMAVAMVRPETLMKRVQLGTLELEPDAGAGAASATGAAHEPVREIHWAFDRKGVDRIVAYPAQSEAVPVQDRVGVVFRRRGFADWKLTAFQIPASKAGLTWPQVQQARPPVAPAATAPEAAAAQSTDPLKVQIRGAEMCGSEAICLKTDRGDFRGNVFALPDDVRNALVQPTGVGKTVCLSGVNTNESTFDGAVFCD